MDSEPTDEQTGLKDELRKSVEIVVETDAEVGASGYSVTGGGERGIFVKDVLKDSPAAKHLSLQQGDQLLSAKVYFDNVRYEDALKILQCAEPYKVSFQLKRTVPETEVSVRPRIPSGEVKGPKAKVAKMSVKGTKLFKAQKRRGGRFGLKRLKEKNREELVKEGTPPRLEAGDVNVEFSLPKFKQRKGVGEAEAAVGKGKKRIRFPHMKTKSYTGAVTGGKLGTGRLEVDENICPETSGVEVKTKGKGHKFGIAFPKSKHNKSGSSSQTGSLERKPPDVRIHPPSVEFDVSSDKDVEKRGLKFKSPDVEFALPSGKAEASVSTVEETSESKAPKRDVRGEAELAGGKVHADVSKGDAKLRMPKLKLPKVRLSRHSDEIDSAFKVKTPKAEMKRDGEVELPEGNIRMPKVESDLSGGAASVQIPSVDISLPKVKGKFDAGVLLPESGVKAGVNMPESKVSGLDIDLELNTGQKIPDEVEGMFKGPKISMPKVDISLPKTGPSSVEGPDVGGKFSIPSVGISLPQMKSGSGDVDMDCYVGGDGKFKMPEFDPTLPNMKSSDKGVAGTFKLPKVDLTLPKGKEETADDGRAAFQLPSMKVLPPNMKGDKVKVNTEGGMLKMPEVEISPPKVNIQGGFEAEEKVGKEGKFRIPTVDVSMSKLKQPEGHIEGPEMRSGDEIQLPSHDASLPTTKMEGNIETEGSPAKGGNFTKPSVNVKLPKMRSSEAGVDLYGQKIEEVSGDVSLKPIGDIEGKVKGGKFTLPSVDISLPKMKLPKGDVTVEGPNLNLSLPSSDNRVSGDRDDVKFKVPTSEISLKKGKIKEEEVNIKGPEAKGGKFQMPSFDVSYTQMKKTSGEVELPKLKGGEIKAPTIEISALQGTFEGEYDLDSDGKEGEYSLPGMKLPEGEGNFQGPKVKGSKFEMPKIDLSLPRRRTRGDFEIEIYNGKDGNIEIPSCDFGVPKGELSADLNVDNLEGRTGKLKMPKIDKSLPKLNLPGGEIQIEGPEIKGQMEKPSIDNPEGKLDVDIDSHKDKASKFHMTTININLPKIKSKEVSIDLRGSEGQEGNLPSWDITMPDKKFPEADVSLEGPNVSMPGVEVSLPKTKGNVGISVETPKGNEEKLQMPKFDIALPKVNFPDSGGKIKKLDQKTKKVEMSDIDVLLPKGKAEADIEIDGVKGRKFHIPSVDFSLPRIKTKGSEVKTEGVQGKVCMPDTDVSLSKEKVEGNTNVEGPEVKAGKFKMPKFDISFPNKNLPEGKPEVDVSITKGKIKENVDLGGRFPTVDISLPKLHAKEVDTDIKSSVGANLDISLPKASLPGGDIKIVDPKIKGGKIEMPDIDLCLSKGKPKGDIEITGSSHKGGKFHMPTIDITLPKMKTKGAEVHVEGPEVKGGQIKMPSLDVSGPKLKSPDIDVSLEGPEIGGQIKKPKADISMPKGEVEVDFEAEGPDMKGAKFKMPKFDLSLPKVSLPKFDANVEGPDMKGKAEIPSVDISIPEATTDFGVDVDTGKGSKFHMPSLDISLPKIKTKGPNVNFEGPEIRGDMSLPKIKTPDIDVNLKGPEVERGDVNMPTLDVSLPKPEGNFEVQGPEVKGGKFKKPKLPQVRLPEVDVKTKSPDINVGKIEMPDIDISLPKGKAKGDAELEVHTGKRGKFHMPAIDISLPKIKTKEPEINIKGPEVKGGKIPDIDLSLPRGEVDADLSFEGPEKTRGQLKMPKVDVSLPQIKLAGDVTMECPEMKGKNIEPAVGFSKEAGKMEGDIKKGMGLHMPNMDLHLPKFDFDLSLPSGSRGQVETSGSDVPADVEMSGIKGQLKQPKMKATDASINIEGEDNAGTSLKLPTVKLPTVDISAPKVNLDFGIAKSKGDDVEVELLKAEGGRPSSGGSFDLPDVSLKVPGFSFPRFGGKSKSSELQISKPEVNVSISSSDVEGEIRAPSVEFDDEGKVKVKKPKIKMPSFGLSRKNPDASVTCPEVDVKAKKENVEIPIPNITFKGSDDKTKHKVKPPKFKISSSKAKPPEDEGDVKVEADGKGGFHARDATIKLPKFSMPGFGSKEKNLVKPVSEVEAKTKLKMPSVELSLPETKTPDTEVLLPKAEVDVSEADIKGYEGNLKVPKMPKIDVSIPKVDLDVSLPKGKSQKSEKSDTDVKGEGKFKIPQITMPSLDVSIPKGKSGDFDSPDVEVDVDSGKFNMPYVKMPSVDITFPKPKIGKPLDADVEGHGKKLQMSDIKMPNINISKEKKDRLEGPDFDIKVGNLKMPNVDVNLSNVKAADVDAHDLETPDGKTEWDTERRFKMPSVDISLPKMPEVDISQPKGQIGGPEVQLTGERGSWKVPHISLPSVDISLPKGRADGPNVERGDGEEKIRTPYTKIPSVDVSVTKDKSVDQNVELKGGGSKFQMPHVKMPNVKLSLPKQKDVSKLEPEEEEEKLKMPSVDISIPMRKSHGPDVEAEVGQFQDPHIKIPHVNISLPKGKSDKNEGANVEIKREGGKSKMPHMTLPSVDISLPRGQTKDYSPEIKGERKHYETAKEDISLPKGRPLVESPEVDMKGDVASMAAAKAEGGNIKLSHMKFPKVDISLPKGRSKGISSPAMEMDVTGPQKEVPKVPSSKADTDLPTVKAQGKLKMPQGAHLDSSSEGGHASLRIKIPTIEMKGSKEDLMLETGSHKEEGNKKSIQLPDLDLTLEGSSGKDKGSATKGAKFKIQKHKKKTGKDASTKPHSEEEVGEEVKNYSSKDGKGDINVQLPRVTLPSVSVKTEKCDVGGSSPSTADVRIPRIPDIDFDIGTAQDEDDGRTENKIKIPKFGIPLPSISASERLAHGPEIQYEGPKMPKVKKAVFVLVNPSEPDDSTASLSLHKEQPKVETEKEEVTVKMSKKKIKPGFGKSKDKSATESAERKAEEEEKSKGLKMKMPKVKFSPAKSGSFGVKEDRSSPHKDDKGTFGGKLKLPKVELTSPYGKMAAGEENKGARLEKDSSSFEVKVEDRGLPVPAESASDVVSSQARTEMLDRDSSESPNGFNMEFSSAKVQMWSESKEAEERESSSWFKVPKVTLKPLSSGFLQITPEGSPQAQREGEVAGVEDVSGSFCIHASGLDFAAQQMSEEHHVSASEEGTVTTVTKTTRITQQLVTSQTHTAESSTTTHQVSDSNL